MLDDNNDINRDANRDPVSGAAGSHPVGTGVGAAAGAVAGAAAGSVVGPAGTVAGAVIGGVAGGLAGKGAAEYFDPTAEDAYWRDNYSSRPYVNTGESYEDYGPAYKYGWESRQQHAGRSFGDAEKDLAVGWERTKGTSKLGWEQAKNATRDAWHRVERAIPGDADGDGR